MILRRRAVICAVVLKVVIGAFALRALLRLQARAQAQNFDVSDADSSSTRKETQIP